MAQHFTVPTDPATAITITRQFLQRRGYRPESLDLDAALRSEGDATRGWQGIILHKRNWVASLLSKFLVETIPLLLVIPSLRHEHDAARIAILARPGANSQGSELFCAFVSVDERNLWVSPQSEAFSAFNAIPKAFADEGLEVDAPTAFPLSGRHTNDPLRPRYWRRLVKAIRCHARNGTAK